MKIVSWNVNGLKAVIKNRQTELKKFLDYFDADIICLQETKATRSLVGIDTAVCEGYSGYFSFCRLKQGYSGVATFCRNNVTPMSAEEGITGCGPQNFSDNVGNPAILTDLSDEETTSLDIEGRAVITEHSGSDGLKLVVINVYCPRVDPESPERLPYKLNFLTAIRKRCIALCKAGREIIVCGDFNCTRDIIDSASLLEMPTFPKESETRDLLSLYTSSTVTRLEIDSNDSNLMLIDSFRFLHPTRKEAYTCWCTKTDSRKLNYGQRIDYIFMTSSLVQYLVDSQVLQGEQGSDHCPVTCQLSLSLTSSPVVPSLSSTHYPEFAGKQTKLSTYFVKAPTSQVKRSISEPSNSKKRVKQDSQANLASLWSGTTTTTCKDSENKPEMQTARALKTERPSSLTGLSTEWLGVFKGPPKAPLCPGHNEPAVLRTVKKAGPNKNKKFYVCGRPDGAKSDPQSRCDFFQWANGKK